MLYAPCSALLSGMEKVKAGEREIRSATETYNIMYVPLAHSISVVKEENFTNSEVPQV
jgi:hypothetical protein